MAFLNVCYFIWPSFNIQISHDIFRCLKPLDLFSTFVYHKSLSCNSGECSSLQFTFLISVRFSSAKISNLKWLFNSSFAWNFQVTSCLQCLCLKFCDFCHPPSQELFRFVEEFSRTMPWSGAAAAARFWSNAEQNPSQFSQFVLSAKQIKTIW